MARSRFKTKGRRNTGSYVAMPKEILESTEYASLTAYEVKLLLDLFSQYNGYNNGDFTSAWTIMKGRGWNSQDTLNRALRGLIKNGFIQRTRQGGRHLCSLYGVSWLPIDECKGKLDIAPTKIASGAWKKLVLREAEHITTGGVAIHGR